MQLPIHIPIILRVLQVPTSAAAVSVDPGWRLAMTGHSLTRRRGAHSEDSPPLGGLSNDKIRRRPGLLGVPVGVAAALVLGGIAIGGGAAWLVGFQNRGAVPRIADSASLLHAGTSALSRAGAVNLGDFGAPDPVWWIADEADDFYERTYGDTKGMHMLREINRKQFFTGMCGHYRFNVSAMPDISVIVTVQNEQDQLLSLTVHSILARTPPEMLKEIIIVDDNGKPRDIRGPNVNETEFEALLALSPKVLIMQNELREGCARSRMVGAKAALGDVLMFVDSHIEMMSSTWAQHLLAPILENPHTMALQTLDIISDLDHSYGDGSGDLLYGIITNQFFFGYQRERFAGTEAEKPGRRVPYETPFGPGSLFAIRRDEFWRLGGYDKGLYVWGGENTELALKIWMCGGRMVMVPCSRVGHMYRIHLKEVGRWPPKLPQELTDKLGCGHPGEFKVHNSMADNFTRIITRNNMRVMNLWVRDHPAKYGYYKHSFGTEVLPPEWKQFEEQLKTDPAALEQVGIRENLKCKDFAWFDRHVYKKLTGFHHPWHPSIKEKYGGKTWL